MTDNSASFPLPDNEAERLADVVEFDVETFEAGEHPLFSPVLGETLGEADGPLEVAP